MKQKVVMITSICFIIGTCITIMLIRWVSPMHMLSAATNWTKQKAIVLSRFFSNQTAIGIFNIKNSEVKYTYNQPANMQWRLCLLSQGETTDTFWTITETGDSKKLELCEHNFEGSKIKKYYIPYLNEFSWFNGRKRLFYPECKIFIYNADDKIIRYNLNSQSKDNLVPLLPLRKEKDFMMSIYKLGDRTCLLVIDMFGDKDDASGTFLIGIDIFTEDERFRIYREEQVRLLGITTNQVLIQDERNEKILALELSTGNEIFSFPAYAFALATWGNDNQVFWATDNRLYKYDIEAKENRLIHTFPSERTIHNIVFIDKSTLMVHHYPREDTYFKTPQTVLLNYVNGSERKLPSSMAYPLHIGHFFLWED